MPVFRSMCLANVVGSAARLSLLGLPFAMVVASAVEPECLAERTNASCGAPSAWENHAKRRSQDAVLMQIKSSGQIQRVVSPRRSAAPCCDGCARGVAAFCSSRSGSCYSSQAKDYYQSCPDGGSAESCCDGCFQGVAAFCSPKSGSCYPTHAKGYYQSCPGGGLRAAPTPLPQASSSVGSIKFMSYNLMGWNAFNQNAWRGVNVLNKIKAWSPTVLGAQEVEKGGGGGYSEVRDKVMEDTGLDHAGGSQFFKASVVEQHETAWINLPRGYWMSMTRFKHKETGVHFLFFNSHWKHGYGHEQAEIIANAVQEQREKHGSPPTVLAGDTNQFCIAHEEYAVKYLTGEIGSSPVTFVDAILQDRRKSFNPDCRIDYILASAGQWSLVQSSIDREGMGNSGTASDHAALMAELVPIV